jgi:hypothetical protein
MVHILRNKNLHIKFTHTHTTVLENTEISHHCNLCCTTVYYKIWMLTDWWKPEPWTNHRLVGWCRFTWRRRCPNTRTRSGAWRHSWRWSWRRSSRLSKFVLWLQSTMVLNTVIALHSWLPATHDCTMQNWLCRQNQGTRITTTNHK